MAIGHVAVTAIIAWFFLPKFLDVGEGGERKLRGSLLGNRYVFEKHPDYAQGGDRPDRSGRDVLPAQYFEDIKRYVLPPEYEPLTARDDTPSAAKEAPAGLFTDLIQSSLNRLRDSTEYPVLAVDRTEQILVSNALADRLLGYGQGELNGRPLRDIFNLAEDPSGSSQRHRATGHRADGSLFSAWLNFSVIDSTKRIVAITIDHEYEQGKGVSQQARGGDAPGNSMVQSPKGGSEIAKIDPNSLELSAQEMVNPMRAIMELAQLIAKDADNLTPQQRRYLQAMQNRGNRFIHQIEDIDLLIQLQEGVTQPKEKPFDVFKLIEKVVSEVSASVTRDGVSFLFNSQFSRRFLIQTDEDFFLRVLRYLLNAAQRATPQGEIEVILSSAESSDGGLSAFQNLDWDARRKLRLEVRVPGKEFSADVAQKLKNLGARSDETALVQQKSENRSDPRQPDLLGLTLAEEICRLLGGALSYSGSEKGEGAFSFEWECDCLDIE